MILLNLPDTIKPDHSNLYLNTSYRESGVYKHPTMPDYILVVEVSPTGTVYNIKYSILDIILKQCAEPKELECTVGTIAQQPVITAYDLLKAIAITQDPKLSTTLLHPSMR